jgi:hypothetical protein
VGAVRATRVNRDRGGPCGPSPPTPPCVRVRTRRFGRLSFASRRAFCRLSSRAFGSPIHRERFGPLLLSRSASRPGAGEKASSNWLFRRVALIESRFLLTTPSVRAFIHRSRLGISVDSAFRLWSASLASPTSRTTTPSADFSSAVGGPYGSAQLALNACSTLEISRGKPGLLHRAAAGFTERGA